LTTTKALTDIGPVGVQSRLLNPSQDNLMNRTSLRMQEVVHFLGRENTLVVWEQPKRRTSGVIPSCFMRRAAHIVVDVVKHALSLVYWRGVRTALGRSVLLDTG
jgi:hypothetical protein